MLSLQKFDNNDISKIEQMAKDQYKNWLDENTDTNHFVDHFGPIYHTKPEQFTFTCGDIKMIQQISEYVQSTIRKKGYGYFKAENSRCPKNTKRHGTNNRDASEEELQQELFNGVSNLLQPYGEHVVSLFKKEMVIVANEDGVISGRVRCVICDTEFDTEGKKKKGGKSSIHNFGMEIDGVFQTSPTIIYIKYIPSKMMKTKDRRKIISMKENMG